MSNNDIDRVFTELKTLFQKKGYLLFEDLERNTDGLPDKPPVNNRGGKL